MGQVGRVGPTDPRPLKRPRLPVSRGLLQAFLGSVAVYAALLATGSGLYGDSTVAVALAVLAGIAGWGVLKLQTLTHAS